jgi:hypothetical protein
MSAKKTNVFTSIQQDFGSYLSYLPGTQCKMMLHGCCIQHLFFVALGAVSSCLSIVQQHYQPYTGATQQKLNRYANGWLIMPYFCAALLGTVAAFTSGCAVTAS